MAYPHLAERSVPCMAELFERALSAILASEMVMINPIIIDLIYLTDRMYMV